MMHAYRTEKEDKSKSEQAFEVRLASTFTTMREDLERTAKETNTHADEILGLLGRLEELHLQKCASCQIIKEQSNTNKETFDSLLSTYSYHLEELAPWRKQAIQTGEEAAQVQSSQMQKSRKDVMDAIKRRLDRGREKQQLATDASELLKHYKALIMAA